MTTNTETLPTDGQFDLVAEITNAILIIDHASEQGAFKGWDTIQKVLGVRARLQAFVGAVAATLEDQQAAAPAEVPDEKAETPKKSRNKPRNKPATKN